MILYPYLSCIPYLLESYCNLSNSTLSPKHCNSCACNKSHHFPFSLSTINSTASLQLVYTDLWTSPILSYDGYNYYVIFVDHISRHIWFHPLKQKSDTATIFPRYKALVEKYFKTPILHLYSDNGGEYEALKSYLSLKGIFHLTKPPHTPQYNELSERRHRQIVETGLAPLATCIRYFHLSHQSPLNNSSPYLTLFKQPPNYHKLRAFDYLCYSFGSNPMQNIN